MYIRQKAHACVSACGGCHETSCRNGELIKLDVDIEDKHEDFDDIV